MSTVDSWIASESELERVIYWRFEQLCLAGYTSYDALRLAGLVEIDLHRAIELIQKGCSPSTAARILL